MPVPTGLSRATPPNEVEALLHEKLLFEIQGDESALPWVGRKIGRQAFYDFVRDIETLTETIAFDVEDVLASDSRSVIVGALEARIRATGKTAATQFAIVLTMTGDLITRFQMLEDSFNVAEAARL